MPPRSTAAKSPANEVRQTYQQQLAQVERQSNGPLDEAQRNEIKTARAR